MKLHALYAHCGNVTLRGQLVGDAQFRLALTEPGPHAEAWIYCNVATSEAAAPVHVRYKVPGRGYATEYAGKAKADAMRRGARVTVHCAGLQASHGGLMAVGVERITLDEVAALGEAGMRVGQ